MFHAPGRGRAMPVAMRPDGPSDLLVRELTRAELLHAQAPGDAWDELAHATAEPNPFLERWFLLPSVRHLAPPDFRLLLVEGGSGQLIGLMPVCIQPRYGRIPLRHVQNWLHYHSFLGTPLIRGGHELLFWRALLHHVDAAGWRQGLFHVSGLIEDGPVHRGLQVAARDAGKRCDTVHRLQRAFLQSDLSPTAYYEAHVRKKKRKELARLRNRLEEIGRVELHCHEAGDALDEWCESFLRLESSGWKGRSGSARATRQRPPSSAR